MRAPVKCETCGEEIIFDLEGVNVFSPGDSDEVCVRPLFDQFGREKVLKELDKIMEMKGFKKIRFFEKCQKCGSEFVFVFYTDFFM